MSVELTEDLWAKIQNAKPIITDEKITFKVRGGEVETARFLTRSLKLNIKDDELRDLASTIELKLKAPSIYWCETIEDYTKLYTFAPTCMTIPPHPAYRFGESYVPMICKEIYEATGMWSSIWYKYIPDLRAAAFVKQGRWRCRVFVRDDFKIRFGPYSDDYSSSISLVKELDKLGYKDWRYPENKITKEFRVPGIEYKGELWFPYPKSDYFSGFYLALDKKTNECVFGEDHKNNKQRIGGMGQPFQWVPASKLGAYTHET